VSDQRLLEHVTTSVGSPDENLSIGHKSPMGSPTAMITSDTPTYRYQSVAGGGIAR
jgi:hypothetical protein